MAVKSFSICNIAILFYQVMGPDRLACVNNTEFNASEFLISLGLCSDNFGFSINSVQLFDKMAQINYILRIFFI